MKLVKWTWKHFRNFFNKISWPKHKDELPHCFVLGLVGPISIFALNLAHFSWEGIMSVFYQKADPAVRAKSCSHVNRTRTRTVKPHQPKCLPTSFPHNSDFNICHLLFWGSLSCKVFLGAGLFFRPRRILIFCRQVNNLILKLFSKKALLEVLVHVFLRKKSKFEKKSNFCVSWELQKKRFFFTTKCCWEQNSLFLVTINF